MIAALQYFVVGSLDSQFSREYDVNLSAFLGVNRTFQMVDTSITDDATELRHLQDQLQAICGLGLIPVVQMDPVVGGSGKDQTQMILDGQMDAVITSFLHGIHSAVTGEVLFVIGGRVNERPSFAQNPTNYKAVYVKLRKMVLNSGINAKFAFSVSGPICLTNGSSTRAEFATNTYCKYSIQALYPGDEHVDFVLAYAINEREEDQTAAEIVRKAMFAAAQASEKPVIVIAGSKSKQSVTYKNDFIQEMLAEIDFYTQENEYYAQRVVALLLYNVEVNYDTALYYSLFGEESVGETNNGQTLFSYSALRHLKADANVLQSVDRDALMAGALCDPGSFFGGSKCLQCPGGHFQAAPGQVSCVVCQAGSYQTLQGQKSCERCPDGKTTVGAGAMLIDECVCPENQEESADGCVRCPKNSFSRQGGECQACLETNARAQEGGGCYCKRGFRWSSDDERCVDSDSGEFGLALMFLGSAAVLLSMFA